MIIICWYMVNKIKNNFSSTVIIIIIKYKKTEGNGTFGSKIKHFLQQVNGRFVPIKKVDSRMFGSCYKHLRDCRTFE